MTRDAYSHEVSSCGFWPGGGPIPHAAFYAYAYPEPPGFAQARVKPAEAFYSGDLRNSSSHTMSYDSRARRTRPCLIFCRRRMKPRPIWRLGIAEPWSVSTIRR